MSKYINYSMSNNNDHDLEKLPLQSSPSVDADASNYSDEQSEVDDAQSEADAQKKLTEGQAKYKELAGVVRAQRQAKSHEVAKELTGEVLENKTDVEAIHRDEGINKEGGTISGSIDPVTQKDPDTRININDPDKPLTDAQAEKGAKSLKDAIAKRNDDTIDAAAAKGEAAKVEVAKYSEEKNKNRKEELAADDTEVVDSSVERADAIAKGPSFSGDGGVDKAIVGMGDDVPVSGPVVEVTDKDSSESIEEQGQV